LIDVRLAWTMLSMPKKMKLNAIFGFIAYHNLGVIHHISIPTNIMAEICKLQPMSAIHYFAPLYIMLNSL